MGCKSRPRIGMENQDIERKALDEDTLIELAKQDREAFGKLYELHIDRIYNYVYYRVGNSHDAEDLTARVFFRAIQHIGNYQNQGVPFSAWLYRIARNMLANWYRDNSKRQMISLDSIGQQQAVDNPEYTTELREDRDALLAGISRLPPDRQELLILKYVERMSNAEIGQIMERSEGAIKSLYHRTMLSLRDDLLETARRERTVRRDKADQEKKSEWVALSDTQGMNKGNGSQQSGRPYVRGSVNDEER
jgi:RNA polymerase sigma-70 factor (ECF subfamily)